MGGGPTDTSARSRRHPPVWTYVGVGVLVAAVLFFGVGPPAAFLPRGTVCDLGPTVGMYSIWAPVWMANYPDGGNVSLGSLNGPNYTFTSGSLTVGALPSTPQGGGGAGESAPEAGIFASYGDYNFTFFHTSNVSQVGASSDPCTQPYVATVTWATGFCQSTWSTIPLPDNSSDVVEPHVWNGTTGVNSSYAWGCPHQTPGTSVWFDNALNLSGTGVAQPVRWNLCSTSQGQMLNVIGIAQIPVVVTVPFRGGSISASGYLTWTGSGDYSEPAVTYNVPGGWMWTLGPVGPVSSALDPTVGLPGLVAFERSAC